MKILADASLPSLEKAFPKPFELSLYHQQADIPLLLKDQQILLCRSSLKVTDTLLAGHSLRYLATASSGTDHIDSLALANNGITLLDAKGSNARAVADYVIATLAFLQKYHGFVGKKAGVIGIGEVGTRVVNRLLAANFEVIGYDPLKSNKNTSFYCNSLQALTECDLLCVHANWHNQPPYPSVNLLDHNFLRQLKPGTVIINAARGGIVNEEALLSSTNSLLYCTDVYNHEPLISKKIIDFATLCTPHIAGHSIEAKWAAVEMISQKLHMGYQLSVPPPVKTALIKIPTMPENESWQDNALFFFNPLYETTELKNAIDVTSAFLTLRKQHQHRHDFCVYDIHFEEKACQIFGLSSGSY